MPDSRPTGNPPSPEPTPPARTSVWQNWITLAGGIIAGGALFAFLLLFAMDLMGGGKKNPYLGLLSYLVAPGFLILGLILILGGAAYQHHRRTAKPLARPPRMTIDLSRPRDRWTLIWFGVATLGFLLLTAIGSYQTYQYTESVQFCGQVCHTVMQPEYTEYNAGAHARVACTECHVGAGAAWYVKAKISGLHQVYAVLTNRYDRPIPTPVSSLRPARDTCEQCHWPEKYSGSIEVTKHHYLSDDQNTPYTVRLLVHVGGGSPRTGPVGGIHWHMLEANKVEYYASDARRQVIPWVRVTTAEGRVTEYRTADFKGEPDPAKIRRMDCMDCHNRPAHKFLSPNEAVDQAMYLGRIDVRLKAIKRTAVDLLTRSYTTQDEACDRIGAALRGQYPKAANLAPTIAAVQAIYRQNFFPRMHADWSKYPDNIGHLDSQGCFRCHDGKHLSTDGKGQMPATDCDTCHTILAQGSGADLTKLAPEGVAFQHPSSDISGLGLLCSDCHNGKNQDN